jgi:hypothetical protein
LGSKYPGIHTLPTPGTRRKADRGYRLLRTTSGPASTSWCRLTDRHMDQENPSGLIFITVRRSSCCGSIACVAAIFAWHVLECLIDIALDTEFESDIRRTGAGRGH